MKNQTGNKTNNKRTPDQESETGQKSVTGQCSDTSSKEKPLKRSRYHHGDLKQALLNAAEEILVEKGSDGLTMRDLSKRIGVSRTAAYHHFKDRGDLLAALATLGMNQLMAAAEAVMEDKCLQPYDKFEKLMLTYVRFAADNPEKYKLMVGNDLWLKYPVPELQQLARHSFRRYVGWITYFSEHNVFYSEDPLRTSQLTWATLHGVCRLLMDGIFARRSDLEEMVKYGLHIYTRQPKG